VKRAKGASAQAADALAWVFGTGDGGPFAFVNVCDTLGIDAQKLRERVRAQAQLGEKQAG